MELYPTQEGFLGEIARGFTFAQVARLAAGFGERVRAEGLRRAVVAHDARFLAKEMAEEAAGVLAGLGLETHLLRGPTPLPLFGFALEEREAAGFYLTAGRRPARYQGVRLRLGPGLPLAPQDLPLSERAPEARGSFQPLDLKKAYLERLAQSAGEGAKEKKGVVYLDTLGGAGGGVMPQACKLLGLQVELRELHPLPHPLFYGVDPDPRPENLGTLLALLRAQEPPAAGFALDGDGDRLAVILPGGEVLPPQEALARLQEALGGLEVEADGEGGYLFPWHLKERDPFLAALLLLKVLL
ncbi:phosphoglucomutase [Thermus thermamylovorans]|uniref:Phosphoglucomutase n=1 Tax=Thermus thermamylovorans TaxID=2509362 RepID=A0A4Q9B810_9DEIN|nr:phosphoglucomutase [Thermus thermamylovorans]TBH21333.1 phosphoglucomutase [Thermus thermamylovorans]